MNEFTINSKQIIKELYIFLGIFILGIIVNIYAIIIYDGFWSELFSQLLVVFTLTATVYLIVAFIRMFVYAVGLLVAKFQKSTVSKDS